MLFRFTSRAFLICLLVSLLISLCAVSGFGQTAAPSTSSGPVSAIPAPTGVDSAVPPTDAQSTDPKPAEIKPDLSDPSVIRAQQSLDRVRGLVRQGVLPTNDLAKAMDDLNDALDNSILRYAAFNQNLLPEQADQMVAVAQRMFMRRQRRSIQLHQLAATGVLSRSEADEAGIDLLGAKLQFDLAVERASLVKEMALQRSLVDVETDAEAHPEWNGKVYTRYDGNGVFTRSDFNGISASYLTAFGHSIPISADGQTAVHRAMGFNHTGRIDVALNPDQREGAWLLRYLERNHIPYFAFKTAVAHKATGAHIHLGPGSTKLSATTKACCGS